MRRNRNMARGGGRGGSGLNISGGPLLTEHLNLKDIDLELELLKRKREMIEQQQNQFVQPFNSQPPLRNFNQQPYYGVQNERGGDSNVDFSHLYNSGPSQFRKPFGKKRQSDSDWQHDSFPKRPSGPGPRGPGPSYAGPPPPARDQRPGYSGQPFQPKPFKYAQAKQFMNQKVNQKPQKAKNFAPNKVTKPNKSAAPPNKLAAQPVAERNELVAAAMKSVAEVETREREAMRLLPDKVPTKQMTGRLELALGAILRDIREKCAETDHEDMLRAAALQRIMKQGIRERVRTAMLGKVVGTTIEIIKEYRAMFPKETDIEIVNMGLEAAGFQPQTSKPVTAIVPEKERPDDFYKENMSKLIDLHLQQIFNKIDEIYNPPETEGEIDLTQDEEPVAPNNGTEGTANSAEANKTAEAGDADKSADSGEADKTADGGEAIKTANGEEANKTADGEAGKVAKLQAGVAKRRAAQASIQKSIDEVAAKLTNANPDDYKRMLPRMLKRHIPTIQKMLHINRMYRTAVADLTATTRAKYVEYGKSLKNPGVEEPKNGAEAAPANAPAPSTLKYTPNVLPYYVKVMGKPQLPKKRVMQAFLEIFHPKSIKKHRSIHNLLFIGFSEKSDFDGIIQADGQAVGRSTLSIRPCDKTTNKPDENADGSTVTDANESRDNSDILGSELDGQITDLLSSIRSNEDGKSEENAEGAGTAETPAENVQENVEEIKDDSNGETGNEKAEPNADVQKTETNGDPAKEEKKEKEDVKTENANEVKAENDAVAELKSAPSGRSTPVRSSSRLANTPATPSSIRTRRASRLMQ